MRVLLAVPCICLSLVAAACDPGIIRDDWGPPAGYAAVEGTVTRLDTGAPLASAEVWIARCDELIGYLGSTHTDERGTYHVTGSLPPVGAMGGVSLDTLRVRCEAGVSRGTASLDSVSLQFFRTRGEVVPHTLDLQVP
jgi:hypothetical protein